MKRKLIIIFLSIICMLCLSIGISACSNTDSNEAANNGMTEYTVIYDANGGAFTNGEEKYTQTINASSTLTAPTSPTRTGYTFSGWTKTKNGSTMWQFGSDKVTSDIILYASWSENSAAILSVDNASIDGSDIFMLVDIDTDSVSLSTKIICSSDSTWKLYSDKLGQTEIPTKIAVSSTGSLKDGENIFYIVVTSNDNSQVNVYTLNVYRIYAVTVSFYNGIKLLKTETVYTSYSFSASYEPDILGYTFNYWETSSGAKFTEEILWNDLSLYAEITANTYTVTYDVNGGNELSAKTTTVIYGSNYNLEIPEKSLYTFSGWYYDGTQLTNEEGKSLTSWNYTKNITITAQWTENQYIVALNINEYDAGDITGNGSYTYGESVTIAASQPNLGYTWVGWYNNTTLYTENLTFNYTVTTEDIEFTAVYNLLDDMLNYEFTSTATTCRIYGVKDTTVTEIIVPDYVTEISSGAFKNCSSLVSITLPFVGGKSNSSTASESTLFGYIFGTTNYTGASSTTQYYTSSSYKTFYIPSTLTTVILTGSSNIFYGAFYKCSNLTNITIPDSITSIENYTFYYCTSLKSITIPENITSFESKTFYYCTSLTLISVPDSITYIESGTFDSCTALTYNEYKNGYYLGNDSNKYVILIDVIDTSKTSFSINSNTKIIYDKALYYYTSLTNIVIPSNVTYIGISSFQGCTSLTSVIFENTNDWYIYQTNYIIGHGSYTTGTTTTCTTISGNDLSDSSTAATYLTSTYYEYYWCSTELW